MKTELTKQLQDKLFTYFNKQGTFGCFECTIGWFGCERVDFLTYETSDIWRCFEIKVSEKDFHSKASNTFVGHFNYYVMPWELWCKVKDEIPKDIGVYIASGYQKMECVKKAKKQELKADEKVLWQSMIRSMSRDNDRYYKIVNIVKE